jgi:hypothetical protein
MVSFIWRLRLSRFEKNPRAQDYFPLGALLLSLLEQIIRQRLRCQIRPGDCADALVVLIYDWQESKTHTSEQLICPLHDERI